MPWQISIILSNLFASFRAIDARRIGGSKNDLTLFTLVVSFICVTASGFAYVVISGKSINGAEAWNSRYFIALMAFGIGLGNLLSIKLFRLLPASIVAILVLLNPLSAVIFSLLFLGEELTVVQWAGAALVFAGVLSVQLISKVTKIRKKKVAIHIGLVLATALALLYGIGITTEKYLLDRMGMSTYVIYGWGSQLLMSLLIALLMWKQFSLPKTAKYYIYSFRYGLLLGASGLLYVFTQVQNNSASLTVIGSSSKVALTVFLAYLLLNEREHVLLKSLGIALSGIGMWLLFQ